MNFWDVLKMVFYNSLGFPAPDNIDFGPGTIQLNIGEEWVFNLIMKMRRLGWIIMGIEFIVAFTLRLVGFDMTTNSVVTYSCLGLGATISLILSSEAIEHYYSKFMLKQKEESSRLEDKT